VSDEFRCLYSKENTVIHELNISGLSGFRPQGISGEARGQHRSRVIF